MDYATLSALRAQHPAWRLLCSPHAPLIASFLQSIFVVPNVRGMAAADVAEALEDVLFALREQGHDFPKDALEYLNEWAAADKAWLRKYYKSGVDEAQFDLTPATEKALSWLVQLSERQFVGAESRLLTLFDLLKQMSEGSETDPQIRLQELEKKRAALDLEIARVQSGALDVLDDTSLRDRFQQFQQGARELLSDFREVEHNFRQLDRRVREKIALWEGSKGALLEQIMGERDAISDSDQGKNFRAFWDFLLSSKRQEEMGEMLEKVLHLPAVQALTPDERMQRVHYDWLEAGEHTQRTVATLSQQLRRFLDDRVWLENRRIMDLLHNIESKALALRSITPSGEIMAINCPGAEIELPLERPLFQVTPKIVLAALEMRAGEEDLDPSLLYQQNMIDKGYLLQHIQRALQAQRQISLQELILSQPLRHGLAELICYLQLGEELFHCSTDESVTETISWQGKHADGTSMMRQARLPRLIFHA
ncbi:DUF3375 domain-containing protein [Massilia sp. W12]|uniref:DUF3375 domain-containing protein n=1 Tax=Massilia sp. W12 TaxID=3126507 RepID=UPI0030CD8E8C